MIGDQEDGPGCWHVVPARGTPAPQRREQGCKHVHLHEPVPEQFAPPAIGAGAGAVTSRPTGACSPSPAPAGEVWEATGSLTAKVAPENALEKREMLLASKRQVVTRHLAFVVRHPSFPIPRSAFRIHWSVAVMRPTSCSTTWSMAMPLVSISTASSAGFMGAMGRATSRASRTRRCRLSIKLL